jgi:hypothetical protein
LQSTHITAPQRYYRQARNAFWSAAARRRYAASGLTIVLKAAARRRTPDSLSSCAHCAAFAHTHIMHYQLQPQQGRRAVFERILQSGAGAPVERKMGPSRHELQIHIFILKQSDTMPQRVTIRRWHRACSDSLPAIGRYMGRCVD